MLKEKLVRWIDWQSASTNRRIFSSMLVVAILTLMVRVVGAAKELIVAGYFGTGSMVDAFLIAFLLPSFAINVLAGSFSSAVIPTYIRTKDDLGEDAAYRLFSTLLVIGVLFLIAAAVFLAVLSPVFLPVIGSGFSVQTMELTQSLFYWLLPVVVLTGVGRLYAAAINADVRFAIVALTPVITPVCSVASLVLFVNDVGIYALVGGVVVGAAIETLVLLKAAAGKGLPVIPRWFGVSEQLRIVIGQYMPMVAGAFLMSSTVIVDQAMAAMLEPGSVATLNYANKVVAMILGIGSVALGTAVLPYFSSMIAKADWPGVRHTFYTYGRLIIFVTVPLTAIFYIFSESITVVLFERGAFTADDSLLVSQVQSFYLLQIPFYLLGILIVRLLSALNQNSVLMLIASISLPLNIILNYVFMDWLGVAGIALATAAVYLFSNIFLWVKLRRLIG